MADGGVDGGRLSENMGGVYSARERFFSQKIVFSRVGSCFEYQNEAPPHPPPHDMMYKILKNDI